VFLFWIDHGVTIFRVDNPHTKPFRSGSGASARSSRASGTIFLAEAFTRPKVMRYLAKAGFSQSYTYFTWRNTAAELREYLTELTQTEAADYLRRTSSRIRQTSSMSTCSTAAGRHSRRASCSRPRSRPATASTAASSCVRTCRPARFRGIPRLGEVPDQTARLESAGNLKELIARVNVIRNDHPALQQNSGLRFHDSSAEALLWFSKRSGDDVVFVAVNTTPHYVQQGWVEVPIAELGIPADSPFVVEDLLDGATYAWRGDRNYVRLDPAERMAHIFIVRNV
jgi:starch synthase (maltosyl-transferring)